MAYLLCKINRVPRELAVMQTISAIGDDSELFREALSRFIYFTGAAMTAADPDHSPNKGEITYYRKGDKDMHEFADLFGDKWVLHMSIEFSGVMHMLVETD